MSNPTDPTVRARTNAALAPSGLRLAGPNEEGWTMRWTVAGEDDMRTLWVTDEPAAPTEPAPSQASSDALAASLWAMGEAAGDPWAITAGVPSSAGAAPLSGPCCEEAAQ